MAHTNAVDLLRDKSRYKSIAFTRRERMRRANADTAAAW